MRIVRAWSAIARVMGRFARALAQRLSAAIA
jgi:hypothetical protein